MRLRVGLYGGTFDPPHAGHIATAEAARDLLGLDVVLFVVAGDPWQKTTDPARLVSPAEHRFAMTQAAVAGHERLEASRCELDRPGPSYTADTIETIRSIYSHARLELFTIVGTDAANGITSWHHWEVIRDRSTLVVVGRPDVSPASLPPGWTVVRVDLPHQPAVSSTAIRGLLARGAPTDGLLDRTVAAYAAAKGVYAA